MKLLHTSDWHIGRSLFEFSLLDDQREIFEQICSIVRSEQVDAKIILSTWNFSFSHRYYSMVLSCLPSKP